MCALCGLDTVRGHVLVHTAPSTSHSTIPHLLMGRLPGPDCCYIWSSCQGQATAIHGIVLPYMGCYLARDASNTWGAAIYGELLYMGCCHTWGAAIQGVLPYKGHCHTRDTAIQGVLPYKGCCLTRGAAIHGALPKWGAAIHGVLA